jgi:hypothetical protein
MVFTRKLTFDLERTLRVLGQWLLAHKVPLPLDFKSSPLKESARLTQEEHSFLFWLAESHLDRHSPVEARPAGPRPCPDRGEHCRVLGVAQAILLGCDALRDRKEIPHVTQLREAFKEANPELKKLFDAIGDYLQNCELLHEGKWKDITAAAQMNGSKSPIHDHVAVCVTPRELRDQISDLARFMRYVDVASLQSQYSSKPLARGFSLRRRPRPLLLAEMQAALVEEGWTYQEAGGLIDDGESPEPEKVIERVRKRIKSRFKVPKRSKKAKGGTPDEPDTPVAA